MHIYLRRRRLGSYSAQLLSDRIFCLVLVAKCTLHTTLYQEIAEAYLS